MSPELLAKLAEYGPVVLLLAAAVAWLLRRQAVQERALRRALADSISACESRESRLAARISQIEDRQHAAHVELISAATEALRASSEALATNARAFERLASSTGRHQAQGGG